MEKNKNDGVSVKEFEMYAKKHRFELFFCLLFILATFFTLIFWSATLSIFLTGVGAIIALFLAAKVGALFKKGAHFILAKEKSTQMIFGLVALILAIFVAPLIFLLIGVAAGKGMVHLFRHDLSHH